MKTPEAQRQYQREWIAKRRAAYFADKVCAECGTDQDLQLDHIDPRLKVSNAIWSWSEKRRVVELAKCQVLCRPCHVKKTHAQMPITHGITVKTHGTRAMYERHRCRCEPCRVWKSKKNARRYR